MKYSSRVRLSKLEMEEDFLNLMKGLYEERTANTTLRLCVAKYFKNI